MVLVAALVLMADRSWAIRYKLPGSSEAWGLKYDVEVEDTGSDTLRVTFTLADEGRLKPIHSIDLVAFSKQRDRQGGRAYDVNEPIKFKPSGDGAREGTVTFPKKFADEAKIRIITLTVDGQRRAPNAGAYYDIPISDYLKKTPEVASPPARKVTK
ncbi:MAG: hypothetical protein DWQ37_15125 [Planctomycetota bacterium]|nr:MAG: hypothetical protein DWQ37_15125 [Planctomycetota bacterium]